MTEKRHHTIELSAKADKALKRLDKVVAARITKRLEMVAENADSFMHEALVGQWKGYFRLRVGDYRILYWIDYEIRLIKVEEIGNRRDIYDK
jgi:mRNA interferase RelE/StbE